MPKTLFCGDLHTKQDILSKVETLIDDYDQIVFLGDYVDDWGASPEQNYNCLAQLIHFQTQYPDKVVLLLGNHDFSEWLGGGFRCSGYDEATHEAVCGLYETAQNIFKVAYHICSGEEEFLCSHAGFTTEWCKAVGLDWKHEPHLLADGLNNAFYNRESDETARFIFRWLENAGSARGGMGAPSPIWADKRELTAMPIPRINQIVGHTPVSKTICHSFSNGDGSRNTLAFCDTHSTYRPYPGIGPLPIGNNNLLELKDGICTPIPLPQVPETGKD